MLLTTPPSIRRRSAISTGGKTPGIEAAATIASTAGTLRQQHLATFDQVEGNQVQRDDGIGELFELDVPADELAQTAIGDKMVSSPAKASDRVRSC